MMLPPQLSRIEQRANLVSSSPLWTHTCHRKGFAVQAVRIRWNCLHNDMTLQLGQTGICSTNFSQTAPQLSLIDKHPSLVESLILWSHTGHKEHVHAAGSALWRSCLDKPHGLAAEGTAGTCSHSCTHVGPTAV